jgi:LysR family transcriptional regulator, carnitine catabolism transcriptional activator
MDLRRLEVFLAVVDEGSFSGAADELGVSQPAVSQAIRVLEVELGVPLFHRVARGVRLTDAGDALSLPARLALRDAQAARQAVEAVKGLVSGHLELACLPTLAVDPLAPLLGAFRARHPEVSITLLDPEDTADVLDLVRSGRCELGLVGDAPLGDLVARRIATQEFRAVLPPGAAHPPVLSADELAAMPLVAPPRGSSSRGLLDEVLATRGHTPTVVVETAQREALLPLVLAGAGAALVPSALADYGRRLGCEVASLDPPVGRPVSLVRRDAARTPAAAAFCDLADAHAADAQATRRAAARTSLRHGRPRRP